MDFKNLSEIDTLAEVSDNTKVVGLENGKVVQLSADGLKASNMFVIDTTADDYNTEDIAYGDKVKKALLAGKVVWIYLDNYAYGSSSTVSTVYLQVVNFSVTPSTNGDYLYLSVYAYSQWNMAEGYNITFWCSLGK